MLRGSYRRSAPRLRRVGAVVAALALIPAVSLAPVAAARTLTIPDAEAKAHDFSKRTCAQDRLCVRHGVANCRRDASHVVFCRIFDERRTSVQGRYRCTRLIRISFDPSSRSVRVSGIGRWHC